MVTGETKILLDG